MDDLHLKQTEKRCFAVLSGTTPSGEEFMDSPTFFLSRAQMRDRLWFLIFLEALIAIENGSEDYFETDYILAVNEYLVRRSDLSVRMLNLWISGQNFRSMQEVTDFFNDRYRVTGQFFRDNQLLCRREWQETASVYRARWISAVRAQEDIPEEIVKYDLGLGDRKFRENPVNYLLGVQEEERLHYIALIAESIYEYEHAAGTNVAVRSVKSSREFVRDFGNLLNTYVKYPEDPEIPVVYTTRHIDQYARYLVNDDSQHQILLTDNGMSNPWPTSAGSTSYTIDLPEDQDYVYLVYEKIYTGNHQYNNWSTLNIYADESSAEQFLENLTITNSSDTTIEPLGPVQVPLNEIFDIESDSLEPPGSITKIYMSHTKTDQGSNHSNMIIFGPGSTPGEANDVAQTGNGSEIELPLPSGEEVEADATGRYPFYLVYWITYKSKGGNKPFKKRIIYNAKSSRAFATRDEAIIYAANKNEGVDIDTMGYEYKWALLYTGIKYVLRSNGVIVKASDGFY